MEINIKLNKNENEILNVFNNSIQLNIEQLCNMGTFLNKAKQYNDFNVVKNKKNVLCAINYNLDDNNNYWMVLTKSYEFIDIMIPITLDLNNGKNFEDLKPEVVDIIKTITS